MRPSRARGFTLIELLVVIAVLAVLIALLLPAIGKARQQGKMTVCIANVRTQGISVLAYVNEQRECLPPREVWWNRADAAGGYTNHPWQMHSFLTNYEGRAVEFPQAGFPAPQLSWRCPEIRPERDAERQSHFGIIHYAANLWLFNSMILDEELHTLRVTAEAYTGWVEPFGGSRWRRMDRVVRTSDVVMLMDNVNYYVPSHFHRDARDSYALGCDVSVAEGNPCESDNQGSHEALHRRPAVFADGHASALPTTQAYWHDDQGAYPAPEGGTARLFAAEVRHLLWFVDPNPPAGED